MVYLCSFAESLIVQPPGIPPIPTLAAGSARQMLMEAIQYLRAMPRDMTQRANVFEVFARQIEAATSGAWEATRGSGTDGSQIFFGRQGEALIVRPDGHLFRSSLGHGIAITAVGLCPDYGTSRALD